MWLIVVQLIPGKNPAVSKLCFSFSFCVSFCLKGDGLQDDTFNFERAFDPNLFVCVRVCASVCVCVLVRLVSLCLIHLFISSDSTIVVIYLTLEPDSLMWLGYLPADSPNSLFWQLPGPYMVIYYSTGVTIAQNLSSSQARFCWEMSTCHVANRCLKHKATIAWPCRTLARRVSSLAPSLAVAVQQLRRRHKCNESGNRYFQ